MLLYVLGVMIAGELMKLNAKLSVHDPYFNSWVNIITALSSWIIVFFLISDIFEAFLRIKRYKY